MPWLICMHIFFSDFLRFDMSLLLLTVTMLGVSNKHCLLSLFSILLNMAFIKSSELENSCQKLELNKNFRKHEIFQKHLRMNFKQAITHLLKLPNFIFIKCILGNSIC